MRFAILDSHGQEICGWNITELAARTYPRKHVHKRKRAKLERDLLAVLEDLKRELFAH